MRAPGPLKRYIQRYLEMRLGREIVAGKVADGARIKVDVRDGELVFEQAGG